MNSTRIPSSTEVKTPPTEVSRLPHDTLPVLPRLQNLRSEGSSISYPAVLEPRKSDSLVLTSLLQVPFAYIQKQFGYSVESILRPIHCESKVNLGIYPNTFPNTIKEFYWIYTDTTSTWIALGVLDSGLYFLYTAHTAAMFQNKNGMMSLWVASKFANLVQFAMSDDVYTRYVAETSGTAL